MKKIIIAFDGANFSEGALEFARRLNEIEPILLTGIFLPQIQLGNLWVYPGAVTPMQILEGDESEIIQQSNIEKFEKLCRGNGIDYRVHKDRYDFVIPELMTESLYADLLILGSEIFYEQAGDDAQYIYLREAVHDMKCPVLLVPEKFEFPQNIILTFDGSEEAVFAIKLFAYLFPELTKLKTLLVYADKDVDKDIPDRIQMEELVARHYSDLTLTKLNLNPKAYFNTWIMDNKSALLVSGSYGRSDLSQLFKKSFVQDIIKDHRVPVFIAHK